jgi:hypothetical protein
MKRNGSRRLAWSPLVAAFAIAACDASQRDPAEEMAEPADEVELRDDDRARSAPADTIHVALSDGAIEMPRTLAAGPVAFHVQNTGTLAHNFEIEGQGMEDELSEDLAAGDVGVLVVELEPGTYEVYCPVDDHAEKGMRLQVTVK